MCVCGVTVHSVNSDLTCSIFNERHDQPYWFTIIKKGVAEYEIFVNEFP